MSGASIKRGVKPRTAQKKGAARPRAKTVSRMDRLVHALPLSEAQLQKAVSWAVVGGLAAAGLGIAHLAGLTALAHEQYAAAAASAGFEVKRVEVTGLDRLDELKVYEIALAEKNRAMPLVDLARIRDDLMLGECRQALGVAGCAARLEAGLPRPGWIEDARVTRRLPDTLVVDIVERKAAALWEHDGVLSLIDARGVVLANVDRPERTGLPRLIGGNANQKTEALVRLLDEVPALKPQIVSARWVGNRRWDLGFRTGETLALPEGDAASVKALLNFARMDGVSRLLGKDLIHFDMRDPDRAYLRRAEPQGVADGEADADSNAAPAAGTEG